MRGGRHRGRLFLYDADCNLVAIWGGSGQRRGTFKALAAVERQGDSFLALDSEKASLTVFEPTAYMRRVLDALTFYSAGKYIESVERWQEIRGKTAICPSPTKASAVRISSRATAPLPWRC